MEREKKITFLWSFSLMLIGIITVVWAGSNIIGISLPDIIVRIFGIIDMIALPVLVYSSIKKINRKEAKSEQ